MVPRARGRPGRPTQSTRRARERRRRERCCARALLQVSSRKRDDRNIARRPQDFHPVFQTDVDKRRLPRREAGIASCRWTRCAVSAGSSTLWSGCSPLETRRRSSGSGRRPISTAWRGRCWRSRGAPTRRTRLPPPAPPWSGPSTRSIDACSRCWIAAGRCSIATYRDSTAPRARNHPGHADVLVRLFERIRGDQRLRRFLGPKILESLYVLGESLSLPLFEELLVAGHTDPDVDRCEVTRALVAVRKLTGRLAPSAKFGDGDEATLRRTLDDAERRFEEARDRIVPVVVI